MDNQSAKTRQRESTTQKNVVVVWFPPFSNLKLDLGPKAAANQSGGSTWTSEDSLAVADAGEYYPIVGNKLIYLLNGNTAVIGIAKKSAVVPAKTNEI